MSQVATNPGQDGPDVASQMSEEYPVIAQGLTKIFPANTNESEIVALDDFSLVCPKACVLGLLGPNGAGKTTALRILGSVLMPTKGVARIAGYDTRHEPDMVRSKIGFLSSNTALYPRLTVRETLEFFGALHGMPKDILRERSSLIIERLGMQDYADRRLEELSTGMAQKANIARTLLHNPEVLILDEPTNGLDVLGAAMMIDFVAEMKDEGKSVIFSTHILSEAERLCDLIGILNNGRLHTVSTLDELREQTGKQYLDEIFMAIVEQDENRCESENLTLDD